MPITYDEPDSALLCTAPRCVDIGVGRIVGQTAAEYSRSLKAQTRSAARATLEAALERRETRRCHNRSHYPQLDESLQVTFVWSPTTGVTREEIPPIPEEIAALIREVSTVGKLVE